MSTRERILDAALELFARDGVAGTTVTEIERRAHLAAGRGSFYRHFRSKEDVLEALVDREISRLESGEGAEEAGLPTLPDPRSQLALSYHEQLLGLRRADTLIGLLAREYHHLGHLADKIRSSMVANWSADTQAQVRKEGGPAARHDPEATAAVVISALLGYHMAGRFFGGAPLGVDRSRFVNELVELLAPQGEARPAQRPLPARRPQRGAASRAR